MRRKVFLHLIKNQSTKESGVLEVIDFLEVEIYYGCSKTLRRKILDGLKPRGWSSKVRLSHDSNISITAMNSRIALCLQTGNMGRFYSDLLKIQFLFTKNKIDSAIYVVPTKHLAQKMGSNLANFERFVEELKLFQDVITVPMFVIGLI